MRLTNTLRAVALLASFSVLSVTSGCGNSSKNSNGNNSGSSTANPVVATVAGTATITKRQLFHWLLIQAIAQYDLKPTAPVPKGAVSESPSYADCATFLASTQQSRGKQGPQTRSQKIATCKQDYEGLKQTTLRTLLLWHWLLDEGTVLGIRPSESDVRQQMKLTLSFLGPHERSPEQTLADIVFRAHVEAVERKLYEDREAAIKRLPKTLTGTKREKASIEIGERWFSERVWTSRTTCAPGYVMSSCSEYKGPGASQASS